MRLNISKKKSSYSIVFFVIFFVVLCFLFLYPSLSYARQVDDLAYGGRQVQTGEALGLPDTHPIIIIAKIIRIILGFLGIIVLLLIMYAGWMWMTSMGQEEKIETSKKTLKNAMIGLVIIIMSFAIVTFVLNSLYMGMSGRHSERSGGSRIQHGLSAIGGGIIQSVFPAPFQEDVPRNTVIMVTFREQIDPASICEDTNGDGIFCNCVGSVCDKIKKSSVMIYQSNREDTCGGAGGNDACLDSYAISNDNKTFVFKPVNYLGSPSENIWHTVYLSSDIQKLNRTNAFSAFENGFLWTFEVNTKVDLTPPQIKEGGVFPYPDNYRDESGTVVPAETSAGYIELASNPSFYSVSIAENPISIGNSPEAVVSGVYACQGEGTINASVELSGNTIRVDGITGVVSGDNLSDNVANLGCGLSLSLKNGIFSAGNSWTIKVQPEKRANFLLIGIDRYIFVKENPKNFEILVGQNIPETRNNIIQKLNAHKDIRAELENNKIKISALTAGSIGNNISIKSDCDGSVNCPFVITPMSGGADRQNIINIKGAPDNPMNSIIQVNFNEAVVPLTLVGPSNLVKDTIRVVTELGEIVSGHFSISNQYRTVEFVSDNECGVNSCGDIIYCLPKNSNLRVIVNAANLQSCSNNGDCALNLPYGTCNVGVCKNAENENYPQAAFPLSFGVVDAALNSLDGNRSLNAEGPVSIFNENDRIATCRSGANVGKICTSGNAVVNCGSLSACQYTDGSQVKADKERELELQLLKGDNYQWSFMVNDKINLEPPIIESAFPSNDNNGVDLYEPIHVRFDKLMMASSLSTGVREYLNGDNKVSHKLINIGSYSQKGLGYWISSENIDENPRDGFPEKTDAFIYHSPFSDTSGYWSQVGSGVRDIYQNCFLPSKGPGCDPSQNNPSCCFGSIQAEECSY